ncbi:hypothetical protein Z946_2393 [Sulfitobacter noctilucicola]|nr:hypothetical protein Z946_2393 [Sulfitobacter noctilucicola]
MARMMMKAVMSGEEVVEEQAQSRAEFITSRLIAAGAHA